MLIHLGYHKTATTWLQTVLFPQHPQIAYIAPHAVLWEHIIFPHPLQFNPEKAKTFFTEVITQANELKKVPVLSSERLSGNPHSGAYDNIIIAERLKQVFPDAKILLVIREQVDAIVSNYKQYIKVGGICTLKEYLHPPIDGKIPLFKLDNFKYHLLIEHYVKLYGKDNIQILVYEEFREKPHQFIEKLCNFIAINSEQPLPSAQKINESQSNCATGLKRYINRWHGGSSFLPITPTFPKITIALNQFIDKLDHKKLLKILPQSNFHAEVATHTNTMFVESNQIISQSFNLDLAHYGYSL